MSVVIFNHCQVHLHSPKEVVPITYDGAEMSDKILIVYEKEDGDYGYYFGHYYRNGMWDVNIIHQVTTNKIIGWANIL